MEMLSIIFIFVLLFADITKINGDDNIKGRLLTPEEGCGLTNKVKNMRIVGGSEAPIGAWPWMGLLGYEKGNKTVFGCGASLITSRHGLTAGHCISSGLRFIRLGEHDLRTTSDGEHLDIPIDQSVVHEKFNAGFFLNDIAILYFIHDVEFSDRIRPVCLPLDEPIKSRQFVGDNPFVAGFGFLYETGGDAQVLMQLQVPVVDTQVCRDLHLKVGAGKMEVDAMIKDHVICAGGYAGKGFWRGDSGGPLMLPIHQNGSFPFYQIGIVSCSFGCARPNVPGIYAKVQYHADWIKEKLKQ